MNASFRPLTLGALLGLALPLASIAGTPTHSIRDLGGLPGGSTQPLAINEKGEVVGSSRTGAEGGIQHAVLWLPRPAYGLPAGLHDLGDLGTSAQRWSRADDINELGQIVGYSQIDLAAPIGLQTRAFIWQNGAMTALAQSASGAPHARAHGINDLGEIVGFDGSGLNCAPLVWLPNPAHGFPAGVSPLPLIEGRNEGAGYSINNLGQVAGTSTQACDTPRDHLFLHLPDAAYGLPAGAHDLTPDLGLNQSAGPQEIDDTGRIVGYLYGGTPLLFEAFIWESGILTRLGTLPGHTSSSASDLNAGGVIVGGSSASGAGRAVRWQEGQIEDLNNLLPPGSGWVLSTATGINDRGQIVGTGVLNGEFKAFLLEPILFADGFESQDTSAWSQTVP